MKDLVCKCCYKMNQQCYHHLTGDDVICMECVLIINETFLREYTEHFRPRLKELMEILKDERLNQD